MGRYAVFGAILPRRHAAGTQAGTQEQYAEERANGWSPEDLAAYRRERERAAGSIVGANELVGGLVVTEFERPRPRGPVLEGVNSKAYRHAVSGPIRARAREDAAPELTAEERGGPPRPSSDEYASCRSPRSPRATDSDAARGVSCW